ncbi:MAG TPA: hypothetical protein ENH29_01635 [Bacteroidetes bacterium]|nr:hypothetical protein [Bacteroidota bacterium]
MTKQTKNHNDLVESLLTVDLPPVAAERMYRLPPCLFGKIDAIKSQLRRKGVDIIDPGIRRRGEGYLRIALVENEERLKQAGRQIRRAFPLDNRL